MPDNYASSMRGASAFMRRPIRAAAQPDSVSRHW
ncbi:hypothetical protein ABH920_009191 [Catenulispora sp. EB89]